MLAPPGNAHDAFTRLTPDIEEISDIVSNSRLTAQERVRLADMLVAYFASLAREQRRPNLRLVHDTQHSPPAP